MNDPPSFYSLSKHALDQATAMGVEPDHCRRVIANPLVDWPDTTHADRRLAHDGRVKVVYNTTTRHIVTVMWVSHAWLPDRHLPPEQQVSGWINLDARQAEKLLEDWGFVIDSQKDKSNLWTHPDDPEKRLVPFSIPSRGARANGKGSFRTAANIVGVPVARFVQGRDDEVLAELRRKRQYAELSDATAHMEAPFDPLGVNQRLATQKLTKLQSEMLYPDRPATASEDQPMPTMTEKDEKVLAALLEQHAPVASYALAAAVGLNDRQIRESLRKLEKEELAYRVGFAPSRGGAPGALWWYAETYAEPTPDPEPTINPDHQEDQPMPATAPAPSVETSAVIAGHIGAPAPAAPSQRIFTETGTPWPTGGILIVDEDGAFYVARKLVEEGR